jgi:hypothetical protein
MIQTPAGIVNVRVSVHDPLLIAAAAGEIDDAIVPVCDKSPLEV